jgi:hypothetical protein
MMKSLAAVGDLPTQFFRSRRSPFPSDIDLRRYWGCNQMATLLPSPSYAYSMRIHRYHCRFHSAAARTCIVVIFLFPALLACFELQSSTGDTQQQNSSLLANAPLSEEQVVDNLIQMNLERARALHAYHGTRFYRITYHGFPGSRSAEMVVDLKYQSPQTKEFTILSSSGSKLIINKAFKRLLQAEQEALSAEAQRLNALNKDNYKFALIGYEVTPPSSHYVLNVKPKTKSEYLYRGKIWVDAKDFAVTRIDAEPAKNPSFWTKSSTIEEVYTKVDGFWLPAYNHSISSIRLGGSAELTIQYKDHQITSADPINGLPNLQSSR